MKKKLLNEMIDYCLFSQSLSDFVKAHYRALLPYKVCEIKELWRIAKQKAWRLMCL